MCCLFMIEYRTPPIYEFRNITFAPGQQIPVIPVNWIIHYSPAINYDIPITVNRTHFLIA